MRGPAKDLLRTIPEGPGIIAEIKRASPSKGWIRRDLDAVATAAAYLAGGAWAISVLTEGRNFGGSLTDLSDVRAAFPEATLLRKDFVLDDYMLAESRAHGADLVLLMVSVLGEKTVEMAARAFSHRLEPLVEVRDAAEIAIAARSGARLDRHQQPGPGHVDRGPVHGGAAASPASRRCVPGRGKRHLDGGPGSGLPQGRRPPLPDRGSPGREQSPR